MKKSKQRLVITISDINGTKSYNVSQAIKKYIFFIIFFTAIIVGVSFFMISMLNDKVSILNTEKDNLVIQNKQSSKQIQQKIQSIDELSSKLDNLEDLIGLKPDDNISLITRTKIATTTLATKKYMLQTIPNGNPMRIKEVITTKFGYRIHPILKTKKFHKGLDFRAPRITPIYATADGVVRFVQDKNKGTFGRVINISHNFGFETVYGHLRFTKVKPGQVVKKGQLIALSGNSGRSTGPHLHYEVRYANRFLDPVPFLRWNMKNYNNIFKIQRRVKWESLIKQIQKQSKILEQQ